MRITKASIYTKIIGSVRFVFLQVIYFRRFSARGLGLVDRNCEFYIFKGGKISFGKKVIIGKECEIQSRGELSIGSNIVINGFSRIVAFSGIDIGENVTIAQMCSILDHDHDYEVAPTLRLTGYSASRIQIGSNVWIGEKVTVLKGATIGDNVIIGAGSVVKKDIPSGCIALGTPCKPIRYFEAA